VQGALSTDVYAEAVRADERAAHELGIQGVPFFVMGERYGIAGAQSEDVLLPALVRAWDETAAGDSVAEGAVCGPEGCA